MVALFVGLTGCPSKENVTPYVRPDAIPQLELARDNAFNEAKSLYKSTGNAEEAFYKYLDRFDNGSGGLRATTKSLVKDRVDEWFSSSTFTMPEIKDISGSTRDLRREYRNDLKTKTQAVVQSTSSLPVTQRVDSTAFMWSHDLMFSVVKPALQSDWDAFLAGPKKMQIHYEAVFQLYMSRRKL